MNSIKFAPANLTNAVGRTSEGTTYERGSAFICALMKALGDNHKVKMKIGYGVGSGRHDETDRPTTIAIVAAMVEDNYFAFTPVEARALAESFEKAMQNCPDNLADICNTVVKSLRESADQADEVDLKPWQLQ